MNLLKKDKLNLAVENSFEYTFEIQESGLYLIEIIASAKSWWQNVKSLKSFFQDDDLAVKIDSIEFSKLSGKKGFFDGEVAWNGNNLKGLSKTNIFLINLEKGSHSLNFSSDKNPILESIALYKIDETEINYIPEENNPAQDGNRRQWMIIIPVNIFVKKLNIIASAKKYPENKDDDDIKLIIDGNIQKNETEKSHKNWFWCGRILNGQEKEFDKELNLESGLHYIELWADGAPIVENIKIGLKNNDENTQEELMPKRIPTVDDPEWTGEFNDDSEQMILARALWGEARSESREARIAVAWSIKNRLGMKEKWNSYYGIILDSSQYSCFWEKAPNDPNLQALKNPLSKDYDYIKWKETYEIAGQVMENKISDPTNGANHYYDDSIWERPKSEIPSWIKNGQVILKIGKLNFLNAK